MKLSDASKAFIEQRSASKATATLRNYNTTLNRLQFVVGDIDIATLDVEHVDRMVASMREQGLAAGSINNSIGNLSSFCKWARARGHMSHNQDPIADRDPIREQPKVLEWIPMSQFPHLLDSARDPLDRMLIAMGLYTMSRQSEIVNVQLKDIDLDAGFIDMTIFKSRDTDRVPISRELDRELRRYLKWYQQELGRPLEEGFYLICGKKPVGFQTLGLDPYSWYKKPEEIVRRTLERAGMKTPDRVGVHFLRRSAARAAFDELVKSGYDGALRQVQTWLHHKQSTQTEHYLGLTLDRDARDKQVRGRALFPSLEADNVVPLREVSDGEDVHAAM
mgnify:CR=1 FL=1